MDLDAEYEMSGKVTQWWQEVKLFSISQMPIRVVIVSSVHRPMHLINTKLM